MKTLTNHTKCFLWFETIRRFGFTNYSNDCFDQFGVFGTKNDISLYVRRADEHVMLVLIYKDDVILIESSLTQLQKIFIIMNKQFVVKDMGNLLYFLAIDDACSSQGSYIRQVKYIRDLLQHFGMSTCKHVLTPMALRGMLSKHANGALEDPSCYLSLAGAL